MKEDKDYTITDFFQAAANTEIPDDGFSNKVMERIKATDNKRIVVMSHIWTAVCATITILFIIHSGFFHEIPAAIHHATQQVMYSTWSCLTVMLHELYGFSTRLHSYLIYFSFIPLAATAALATILIKEKRILNKIYNGK